MIKTVGLRKLFHVGKGRKRSTGEAEPTLGKSGTYSGATAAGYSAGGHSPAHAAVGLVTVTAPWSARKFAAQ